MEILNKLENIEKVNIVIEVVEYKGVKDFSIENLYKESQEKILLDLKGILMKKN